MSWLKRKVSVESVIGISLPILGMLLRLPEVVRFLTGSTEMFFAEFQRLLTARLSFSGFFGTTSAMLSLLQAVVSALVLITVCQAVKKTTVVRCAVAERASCDVGALRENVVQMSPVSRKIKTVVMRN